VQGELNEPPGVIRQRKHEWSPPQVAGAVNKAIAVYPTEAVSSSPSWAPISTW
jgi:hypothetical protein